MSEQETTDTLWERAQTRETPLLAKLADLSDDEWAELTHRMTRHVEREIARRGMVVVDAAAVAGPESERLDVERLTRAMHASYVRDPSVPRIAWETLPEAERAMWRRHAAAIAAKYERFSRSETT